METYSPVLSSAIPPKVKLYNEAQHVSPTMTTELQPRVTAMSHKLQWDTLQQRRAYSRVLMLYRIRDGLVATLPQSISSQLWFTPEGSKPATDRYSATEACTIKPSS